MSCRHSHASTQQKKSAHVQLMRTREEWHFDGLQGSITGQHSPFVRVNSLRELRAMARRIRSETQCQEPHLNCQPIIVATFDKLIYFVRVQSVPCPSRVLFTSVIGHRNLRSREARREQESAIQIQLTFQKCKYLAVRVTSSRKDGSDGNFLQARYLISVEQMQFYVVYQARDFLCTHVTVFIQLVFGVVVHLLLPAFLGKAFRHPLVVCQEESKNFQTRLGCRSISPNPLPVSWSFTSA